MYIVLREERITRRSTIIWVCLSSSYEGEELGRIYKFYNNML